MKFIIIISFVLLALNLSYPIIVKLLISFLTGKTTSGIPEGIGIIGGADGPTSIFISSGSNFLWYIICAVCVLSITLCVRYLKKQK
ncbi:MAG: hypothetical protein GX196_06275 [Clostridiaceae bacterium]|nr:hypothetical protein [Clostridiaceae bacterium]